MVTGPPLGGFKTGSSGRAYFKPEDCFRLAGELGLSKDAAVRPLDADTARWA
jgi:hypothetical protein